MKQNWSCSEDSTCKTMTLVVWHWIFIPVHATHTNTVCHLKEELSVISLCSRWFTGEHRRWKSLDCHRVHVSCMSVSVQTPWLHQAWGPTQQASSWTFPSARALIGWWLQGGGVGGLGRPLDLNRRHTQYVVSNIYTLRLIGNVCIQIDWYCLQIYRLCLFV